MSTPSRAAEISTGISDSAGNLKRYLPAAAAGGACIAAGYFLDAFSVKIALFLSFAVVGAVVLTLPYRYAFRLFFVYIGVEGMLKLLSNYNPIIHVGADLLVVALAARVALTWLLRRIRIPEERPPLFTIFLLHFTWFFITFANPYSLSLIASAAGAKLYVTMPLLFFFAYYVIEDFRELKIIMGIWAFLLILQVVTGIYQFQQGPQSVLAMGPAYASALKKFEGAAFRPFGTTSGAGTPSVYTFLGFPFLLFFLSTSRSYLVKLFTVLTWPGIVLLLIYCQVRSALVKTALEGIFFLYLSMRNATLITKLRTAAFAAVLIGLGTVALPAMTERWSDDPNSDQARALARILTLFDKDHVVKARQGALDRILIFAEQVPLGAGLSRTGSAAGKFSDLIAQDPYFKQGFFTDNFWAATIVDVGIPGTLIFNALIFGTVILGFRSRKLMTHEPELLDANAAILAGFLAMITGLWGAEGLLYNPEAAYFWFFAGALLKLPKLAEPS